MSWQHMKNKIGMAFACPILKIINKNILTA